MQDESQEQVEANSPDQQAAEPAEPMESKKKKEQKPWSQQFYELRWFFAALLIGALGYGAYYLYDYMHVAPFEMRDQWGKTYNVDFSEKPTVILFTSQKAQEQSTKWGLKLFGLGDTVERHTVIDFSELKVNYQGIVRARLQEAVPVPVLTDFDGLMLEELKPVPDNANVYVIAPGGRITARVSGDMTDDAWETINSAVETAAG